MKIMKQVEVGLEKDSFQIMLEGMTGVVAVDLDQVQELALTETGLVVINVEYDHFAKEPQTFKIREGNRTDTTDV